MTFLIILFLFVLVVSTLILSFFYIFLAVGMFRTGVPFISRPIKHQNHIFKLMNLKKGEKFFDLGCGDATFLITAEKKYNVEAIGYEISLAALVIARLNIWLKKSKAKIISQDFFKADFSQVDVIFCYLFPGKIMEKLSVKFKKELKPGARIYSLAFSLPNWPNEEIKYLDEEKKKGQFFVYIKP
jgi:SAM-dependent methyltransferase